MNVRPLLLILLIAFCWIPNADAQEKIHIYENEFPTTMAGLDMKGPIKTVKITSVWTREADTISYYWSTYYFNSKGFLIREVHYYPSDTLDGSYTYDSLGRYISAAATPNGNVFREALYDSLGRFSHSVYTRQNGEPKPSFRYYYDEKGRCVRREYRPTADEEELGYEVMQHLFKYDDIGNCIEEAVVVDGDTGLVRRNIYDDFGNVTEYSTSDSIRETYLYDTDNLLVKHLSYYDNALSSETFFEYDEKKLLKHCKYYDANGNLNFLYEFQYDEYRNPLECITYSWKKDRTPGVKIAVTYEYEYYASGE